MLALLAALVFLVGFILDLVDKGTQWLTALLFLGLFLLALGHSTLGDRFRGPRV